MSEENVVEESLISRGLSMYIVKTCLDKGKGLHTALYSFYSNANYPSIAPSICAEASSLCLSWLCAHREHNHMVVLPDLDHDSSRRESVNIKSLVD